MNITVGVQSPKNFLSPDSGQNENKSAVPYLKKTALRTLFLILVFGVIQILTNE